MWHNRRMDISAVTSNLYLGAKPGNEEISKLQEMGITLVISMLHELKPKEYQQTRIGYLRLPTYDFPLLPIPMRKLVKGVETALAMMQRGGKVLVYCRSGGIEAWLWQGVFGGAGIFSLGSDEVN